MATDAGARARIEALEKMLAERDRRYTERFDAQEGANKLALEAAEKAVLKAEAANERRFENVNEFRQTLSDQATKFISKDEVSALLSGITGTLSRLDRHETVTTSRGQGMGQLWGILAGLGGLLIAGVAVAMR